MHVLEKHQSLLYDFTRKICFRLAELQLSEAVFRIRLLPLAILNDMDLSADSALILQRRSPRMVGLQNGRRLWLNNPHCGLRSITLAVIVVIASDNEIKTILKLFKCDCGGIWSSPKKEVKRGVR